MSIAHNSQDITAADLAGAIWKSRWVLCLILLIGTLGSFGLARIVPKSYDAVVIMAPVTPPGGGARAGALGALSSQLGGLTSLAGLSTPDGAAKAQTVATLQSDALTRKFINDWNLLPILFANKWDSSTRTWTSSQPPTIQKAVRLFKRSVRSVEENNRTGLVTLTIHWSDPDIARDWANSLVQLTNEYLKRNALAESEKNLAYLSTQLDAAKEIEVRNSVAALIESEMRTQMMAQGSEAYALKVIDPAFSSDRPAFPDPLIWTLSGLLLSVAVSVVLVLIRAMKSSTTATNTD